MNSEIDKATDRKHIEIVNIEYIQYKTLYVSLTNKIVWTY